MRNPKHEIRNPKQATNSKSQYFKWFGILEIGILELVSNLGFKYWGLSGRGEDA